MALAGPQETITAREAGLVSCDNCGTLAPLGSRRCARCRASLHSRRPNASQRVWAWLLAGIVCYIPANLYPMLLTSTFGKVSEGTIIGGAIELFEYGAWFVAVIVILASVVIPVAKFVVIAMLMLGIRHGSRLSAHRRMQLYEFTEFIGRWSMVDVFVVAILSALVQLGFIASINPGPAAVCFALSVVFTMLSAQSFDPRMIWDSLEEHPPRVRR